MKNKRESKCGEVEYLFFNGDIVPYEKAVIHIFTPAYRYGAMVFEGIRGYWNDKDKNLYLFRVAEHCRRFNQSLKMTRMDIEIKEEEMVNHLVELVSRANLRAKNFWRRSSAASAPESIDRYSPFRSRSSRISPRVSPSWAP